MTAFQRAYKSCLSAKVSSLFLPKFKDVSVKWTGNSKFPVGMTLFFCLCVSYEADLSRVCPVSHPILLEQFPALSHPEQDKQFKDG